MANYSNLTAYIASQVYQNSHNLVTADMVKAAMNQMVASLGAGYQYMGVADLNTPSSSPDYKCFYVVSEAGTYTNFVDSNNDPLVVNDGEVCIFKWDSAWSKETAMDSSDVLFKNSFKTSDVISGSYLTSVGGIGGGTSAYRIVKIYLPNAGNYLLRCPTPSSSRTLWKYTDSTYSQVGATEIVGQSGAHNTLISLAAGYYILSWFQSGGTAVVGDKEAILADADFFLNAVSKYHDTSKVDINAGDNLLNLDDPDILENYYMNASGNASSNASYSVSGFIPVEPNTTYYAAIGKSLRMVCFFNADKIVVTGGSNSDVSQFTTSASCYFVRVTFYNSDRPYVQVSKTLSAFKEFNPIEGYLSANSSRESFGKIANSNSALANGASLTLPAVRISKDFTLSATIVGQITSVLVGVGYLGYYGRWLEITPSQIIVHNSTSGTIISTISHGLTLGNKTRVVIDRDLSSAKVVLFNDVGEMFETTIAWGINVGGIFLRNDNGSGTISANLEFVAKDILKKIWMFGDSYFSYEDPARWPYYLFQWGFTDPLLNAMGGENSAEALADFNALIGTGALPIYALWAMGMNDTSDNGAPDPTWLANTQQFITTCNEKGITPILCTIPTVTSRNHTYKSSWIRSSGYRYIDLAAAVELSGTTTWIGWGTASAMLSSDEVHPTAFGARAMVAAVMEEFPEISTKL